MSDSYLKCSCRACGGHIEFPAYAAGMSVGCPHCGGTTELTSPAAPTPVVAPPPVPPLMAARPQTASPLVPQVPAAGSKLQVSSAPPPPPLMEPEPEAPLVQAQPANWMGWSLAGVAILLFVIGGAMYLNNARQGKSSIFPGRDRVRAMAKGDNDTTAAADEDDSQPAKPKNSNPAGAATAKSNDDLKVSPIVLRKTSGSSLVYAIGTVRNESDQQRFGVTVELDLLDPAGKKIGTAKDYAKVIEPRKEWRFRALVVAPKTASAKLAKIREDE